MLYKDYGKISNELKTFLLEIKPLAYYNREVKIFYDGKKFDVKPIGTLLGKLRQFNNKDGEGVVYTGKDIKGNYIVFVLEQFENYI